MSLILCDPRHAASTGPRPRGRGNSTAPTATRRDCGSFNGAAPARARKFLNPGRCCSIWYVLQRGRARAGAEIRRAAHINAPLRLLQRGRARAGAEIDGDANPAANGLRFNGAAPARARNDSL